MKVRKIDIERTVTYHLAGPEGVTALSGRGKGARPVTTNTVRVRYTGATLAEVRVWDGSAEPVGRWLALTETEEDRILRALGERR